MERGSEEERDSAVVGEGVHEGVGESYGGGVAREGEGGSSLQCCWC